MPYTNIDKQHEDAEARQEARELAIIINATERMQSATDDELDDIAACMPAGLFNDIMRSHLNEYSGKREHLNNSASVQLRQFAHEYFMKVVDKELPQ